MKDLSFSSGGIKINYLTSYPERTKSLPPPTKIILPLKQDATEPLTPLVKKNSKIKAGDVLAKSKEGYIISPVNGKVLQIIKDFRSHFGVKCGALEIKVQDRLNSIKKESKTGILEGLIHSGIIDIQDKILPLSSKLEIAQKNKVKTLIINGLEEIIAHGKNYYFLQKEAPLIKEGIKLLLKLFRPETTILALYNDYKRIEGFYESLKKNLLELGVDIVFLKNKYPQHRIPLLVKTVLGRAIELELDKPIEESIKTSIIDLETIYHLGLFKEGHIPYRDKVITVVKGDIQNTELVHTTIGTPVIDIIKHLDIDVESISKVVINGTISGISLSNIDYPITKDIGTLFLITKGQLNNYSDSICIKCGLCVDVCPMNLLPLFISGYSQSKKFDLARKYHIEKCIECGCCAYICPVNIPMVQWIQYGKRNIK